MRWGDPSRERDREIVGAEVNTGRTSGESDVGTIVDQDRNADRADQPTSGTKPSPRGSGGRPAE